MALCAISSHIFPMSSFEATLFKRIFLVVGGFNPSEKYQSNCMISPSKGKNEKYLKPPPSLSCYCCAASSKWRFLGDVETSKAGEFYSHLFHQKIKRLMKKTYKGYNLSREPTNKEACAILPISKNSRIDVSRIVFNTTGSKFMINLKQFWPNEPPSRHLQDDAFIQAKSSFLSESALFLYLVYRSTCKQRIGSSRLTEAPKHIPTCIIHKHIFICRTFTDDRSIERES